MRDQVQALYNDYLQALARADVAALVDVLEGGLAAGLDRRLVLREVMARGQEEVGRRWERGSWTVADEHAATSAAEQALTLVCPRRPQTGSARRVVVACPEGEWHVLPGRLAAELARSSRLDVTVVGGSLPADQLSQYLVATGPHALALSVTMTTNLVSAWRTIQAAHAVGVPVVVGGAAWGEGQRRALRLGAARRLEDPGALEPALDRLAVSAPVRIPHEALLLSAWDDHRHRSVVLYQHLVQAAAAAVACDDPTILREMMAWSMRPPASGGVSAADVVTAGEVLSKELRYWAPLASGLLSDETERLQRWSAAS